MKRNDRNRRAFDLAIAATLEKERREKESREAAAAEGTWLSAMYCTQCGHDPLLQADNDRRNREEMEAAKAEIEYIRAMNLTLSNRLGEAQAEIKRLTEQMDKLANLASKKKAAVIAEIYIADWDMMRAETSQARAQLAVANTRISELEAAAQVRATPCKWSETDDGDWVTACGVDWVFTDGGPEDNDVRFCPCCGHPVELYQYEPEVE